MLLPEAERSLNAGITWTELLPEPFAVPSEPLDPPLSHIVRERLAEAGLAARRRLDLRRARVVRRPARALQLSVVLVATRRGAGLGRVAGELRAHLSTSTPLAASLASARQDSLAARESCPDSGVPKCTSRSATPRSSFATTTRRSRSSRRRSTSSSSRTRRSRASAGCWSRRRARAGRRLVARARDDAGAARARRRSDRRARLAVPAHGRLLARLPGACARGGRVRARAEGGERYGTVAVFRDLYGNLWDLLAAEGSRDRRRPSHLISTVRRPRALDGVLRPRPPARWASAAARTFPRVRSGPARSSRSACSPRARSPTRTTATRRGSTTWRSPRRRARRSTPRTARLRRAAARSLRCARGLSAVRARLLRSLLRRSRTGSSSEYAYTPRWPAMNAQDARRTRGLVCCWRTSPARGRARSAATTSWPTRTAGWRSRSTIAPSRRCRRTMRITRASVKPAVLLAARRARR